VEVQALQWKTQGKTTASEEKNVRSFKFIQYDSTYDVIYDIIIISYGKVVLLSPCPNNLNPVESFNVKTDFAVQEDALVWYVCPQLFFNYTLRPTGAKMD
jgi:hypothetical protein